MLIAQTYLVKKEQPTNNTGDSDEHSALLDNAADHILPGLSMAFDMLDSSNANQSYMESVMSIPGIANLQLMEQKMGSNVAKPTGSTESEDQKRAKRNPYYIDPNSAFRIPKKPTPENG